MKKAKIKQPIPSEVQWVWIIKGMGQPVGMSTIEKVDEIIDKYPEYFEWEHKYKSIPKKVHNAFHKEAYPKLYEPIDFSDKSGSIEGMLNAEPIVFNPSSYTFEDFKKSMQYMFDSREREFNNRVAEDKRLRKIWDKYYSKYKLTYRE